MRVLALDVGTKRIGVAFADTGVRIALPRNNSGEETRQTAAVRAFIDELKTAFAEANLSIPEVIFQDESYTSVVAEEHLKSVSRRDRADGKVDSEAATLILQDFLERPDLSEIEQKITEE